MTDETAKASFFADDPPPDPRHPGFDFTTGAYVSSPELFHHEKDPNDIGDIRKEDDRLYRQVASPTTWNRFVILGYQTTTGTEFAKLWTQKREHPLRFHRAVWYNYLSYVDRGKDVHEQLYFWANQIAQPFLAAHDQSSLDMDTIRFKWDVIISHLEQRTEEWIPVGKRNRSPRRQAQQEISDLDSNNTFEPNPSNSTINEPSSTNSETTEPMITGTTLRTSDDETCNSTVNGIANDDYSLGNTKKSATQTINEISTNDGTHRIIFKWKLSKPDYNRVTQNRMYLLTEIHSLLGVLFTEQDGCFYRWGNEDLSNAKSIQQLSKDEISDFIAPAITQISTHQLIIFAIRVGYVENPISWKVLDRVKSALKLNNIQVSMSNSKTTSGKLTIAGYVLVKHPKMTHRHRYLKYLRSKLPENTPFFDIVYHRTTPMEQSIGHLAIQCGENHVVPVCQALSAYLTGQHTAVFLPRFAFSNMTDDQIKSHFQMHEQYVKSLHQIPLSPLITNLDKVRVEFQKDGSTLERTTRDWAHSLVLPDGKSAQCDVVNGGSDKNTYLLVPAAFAQDVKPLFDEYKIRLRAVASREARYRESIPDLPNVIHFTPHVQSNLEYIAKLSSVDLWSKAPPSVKTPAKSAQTSHSAPVQRIDWPSLVKRPNDLANNQQQHRKRNHGGYLRTPLKSTESTAHIEHNSDDFDRGDATNSTQSLTNTLRSAQATRLFELESEMAECRNMLKESRITASASIERLAKTEQHLESTMLTLSDLTRNVTTIQTQLVAFTAAMEMMQQTLQLLTTKGTVQSSCAISSDHTDSSESQSPTIIKSPDKKKSKNSSLDDCQRVLFTEYHEVQQDVEMQDQFNTHNSSPQSPDNFSSPPDAQNNNSSDPAGRMIE